MGAQSLLESFGYLVIFLSVFIECGVLLGLVLPLPGFSLLFTAGVFAAAGKLDIMAIIITGSLAAIFGYIAGYFTGKKYGRQLFYKKSTQKYFTARQGKATERFMHRYGYTTLIAGRFLPVVHNVAPLLSGIARTPFVPFMIVNIVGGIFWVALSTLMGFYIGQSLPHAQYYTIPLVIILVVIANSPYGKRLMDWVLKKMESS
jgi:membrane-associated protein